MKKDLRSNMFGGNKNVFKGMDDSKVEDAKRLYNRYAGKDENELKSTLLNMVQQGRDDGTLNNGEIDAMASKIAPMLDGKKREKLNSIIAMLKQDSLS